MINAPRTVILLAGLMLGGRNPAPELHSARNPMGQGAGAWHLVTDWPRLRPDIHLGEVSGVDIDTMGHVLVFHRAGRLFDRAATDPIPDPTVLELEPVTGSVINTWGAGLFLIPHSVTVDRHDNIWLTDVGRHQVLEFSHDGKLLLTVGQRRVPGWDATHFNEPTDVAVSDDGSFFVSDGYQNARVARFTPTGAFLGEWGSKGTGPSQFRIPHGITLDDGGHRYVADRENSRLQVFDASGALLREWPSDHSAGRVFDVAVSRSGTIYVARKDGLDAVAILDRDFHQIDRIPFDTSRFVTPHAIAVQGDSIIYVADTGGHRLLKFVKR